MSGPLQILYLEDNPNDAELTGFALRKTGLSFNIELVQSEQEYIQALTAGAPDLILSDHSLPGFNSKEAFKIMTRLRPGTPFILLTGSVSEQFAVDSLLLGVDDYILKSNLIRLASSIERVLSKKRISVEKEMIEGLHCQLQEAFREIEEKNKEITDSINYAKRIQDAVLPTTDEIMREFSGGFIIYKPRDIVSGDLYWLADTTTTDGRALALKVIAAIDCTGHGVPGAFMSLIVSELLNQTLKHPYINSPADVLSFLNRKLPASLNRNNRERIADGLDMAICALDPLHRVTYFAGANRPLWLLRHNGREYELTEYKGTKASIGDNTPDSQVFENCAIEVTARDRIFLFSDGVTDQFGGPLGKKMGKQAFKEMLTGSAHLPAAEQRVYLEQQLNAWRGALDQIDDMLIICIEVA